MATNFVPFPNLLGVIWGMRAVVLRVLGTDHSILYFESSFWRHAFCAYVCTYLCPFFSVRIFTHTYAWIQCKQETCVRKAVWQHGWWRVCVACRSMYSVEGQDLDATVWPARVWPIAHVGGGTNYTTATWCMYVHLELPMASAPRREGVCVCVCMRSHKLRRIPSWEGRDSVVWTVRGVQTSIRGCASRHTCAWTGQLD